MSNIVGNKKKKKYIYIYIYVVGKPKADNSINNQKIEVAESLTNNSPFASLIFVEALECQSKCFTNN